MLDSYVTTSTLVCKGREGVGGRTLKFLIMGNFKRGGGEVWKKRRVFGLLIS